AVPAEFATSGLNGIALILHHLFGWKMGVVIMLINIPLALISLRYLGRRFLINSIKSIIITSVLLDVITPPLIPAYTGSPFLAAVFHAILAGIGLAMIFMRNSSTGGTDFIIMTINKLRPHMSVGAVVQVIDGAIILIGAFFFRNIDAVLYGVISVIIMGIVMDRMMAGAKTGKVAFIVSEKPEEIAKAIDEEVDRGSTYLRGIGSYTGVERNIVFCACASKELYKVKKTVESIDPKAFLVITDSREVYGEGFESIFS
ncbi:MAG: YitT family protein, partial [Anaerovoracaceae bacterium]|nr:YitT family protein [Anaerovoracaceae bacterium]